MPRLTDRAIAALKPQPSRRFEVFDTLVPGLALRINQGGSKSWVLFYRVGARQRRLTLGSYPTIRLTKARKRARTHLARVSDGADPAAEKRAQRVGETFGDLAVEYLEKYAKKQKRSWGEDDRILRADLLPAWRGRKVREITRRDVRERIEAIAERAPVMANRTWALVSRMFNWAIERDWIDANPAARIGRQPEASRDRVLTHDEIRALWTALDEAKQIPHETDNDRAPETRVSPMIARGLQALLLTAQRPGEVFSMRWTDLELPDDWDRGAMRTASWWTIPEALSKNKEAHRVPVTADVVSLLREARATAPSTGNLFVFAGEKGGSVAARAKRAGAALSRSLGFDFHRHDLRRTAASEMAAGGVARETIAKVLHHVDRGARMTAIYDRYSYDAEKRTALDLWARRLRGILAAKAETGKVLPMRSGR